MGIFNIFGKDRYNAYSQNDLGDGLWIARRFRYKVLCHIIKNHLANLETPLVLCIQGPPGDGKTFQSKQVCKEEGIKVLNISGSSLSGQYEKDSINVLKEAYIRSSFAREVEKTLSVILIDDFDLSVASISENTRNTINTQLLNAFLMNLCDNPNICEGQQTHRTPIIVTGNNFANLYGPMRRHGRVDVFDWVPNIEEKTKMVMSMYKNWITQSELEKLRQFVQNYKEQPVSFFSSLISDIVEDIIINMLGRSRDSRISLIQIQTAIDQTSTITLEQLYEVAILRQKSTVKKYV